MPKKRPTQGKGGEDSLCLGPRGGVGKRRRRQIGPGGEDGGQRTKKRHKKGASGPGERRRRRCSSRKKARPADALARDQSKLSAKSTYAIQIRFFVE